MLPSFWNRPITAVRAPLVAGYGDDERRDWREEVTTKTVIYRCFYASPSTAENNDNREALMQGYVLYLPPTADLLPTDRVRLYAGTYDSSQPDYSIVGNVLLIPSATGRQDYKEARLEVWKG